MAKKRKSKGSKALAWKVLAALLAGSAFVHIPGSAKNVPDKSGPGIEITISIKTR